MKSPLSRAINRRIGQTMHRWNMLAHGDRVLVAVSGGIDSLVLSWLLLHWRAKAPIDFTLHPVHIDTESVDGRPGKAARDVAMELEKIGLACQVIPSIWKPSLPEDTPLRENQRKDICFHCSSNRRRQLFDTARKTGCNKLALGHHQDDLIETFFINLTSAGNISTMKPRQELFEGRLTIIRPLAGIEKAEIRKIGAAVGVVPVPSSCPLSEQTRRRDVRDVLESIYEQIPGSREHIFAALANVRHEYLLHR
ncbi:tRNA lysidine(34) synthetase [Desulfolithobacter sp.]